jgi:hypothetical protein
MCDYSLYEFPNRLAREKEELVTYRFPLAQVRHYFDSFRRF